MSEIHKVSVEVECEARELPYIAEAVGSALDSMLISYEEVEYD